MYWSTRALGLHLSVCKPNIDYSISNASRIELSYLNGQYWLLNLVKKVNLETIRFMFNMYNDPFALNIINLGTVTP